MPATRRMHPSVAIAVFLFLCLSVAAVGAWRLSGGQIYVMETPSMSPITPVGSLVLDRAPTHLEVGDTITFRVDATGPLYTHRLVAILPGGRYKTQGWAETEPDSWVLHRDQIVGKTVGQVRDLGWLYKGLPLWCIGAALYVLVRRVLPRPLRYGLGCLWAVCVLTVPMVLWHPFVDATRIGYTRTPGSHSLLLRVVSTGILPLKVWVSGGRHVPLEPGGVTWVPALGRGVIVLHKSVALPVWGWALVGVLALAPLLGYFLSMRWGKVQPGAVTEQVAPGLAPPAPAAPPAVRVLGPPAVLTSAASADSTGVPAYGSRAPTPRAWVSNGTGAVPSPPPATAPLIPPAQWYPDPYGVPGLLRYWDGSNWTTHVAACKTAAVGAAA